MASGIGKFRICKCINAETIAASGSFTTGEIQLDLEYIEGFFSLQVQVTGTGTCKFEYLLSNNNTDFFEPTGATDIAASITASSGPGSDGKDMYSFDPMIAKSLKIKCTETGGANSVTVTAWLAYQ